MFGARPTLVTPTLRTGLIVSLVVHAALGVGVTCYHRAAPAPPLPPGAEADRFIEVNFMESDEESGDPQAPAALALDPVPIFEPPKPERPQPPPAPVVPPPEPEPKLVPAALPEHPDPPEPAPPPPLPPLVNLEPRSPDVVPERPPTPVAASVPAPVPTPVTTPVAAPRPPTVSLSVATASSADRPAAKSGGGLKRGPRAIPLYRLNPEPPYPALARRRRQEGTVLLRVIVSAAGRASHVDIHQTSGFAALDQAAESAVRTWEFEPARDDGVAIASEIEVPVRFQLRSP